MSIIQLDTSCILKVPLSNYEEDFTFIINGEEFKTSRLVSDLLSPYISQQHQNDPTYNEIIINTEHRGNFNKILQLLNFSEEIYNESDLLFLIEINEILHNESISISDSKDETNKITNENFYDIITRHQKYGQFYATEFLRDIEFISSNFKELVKDHKDELKKLDETTLYEILTNQKLKLKDEDQLLKFINELYENDHKYSILYETVYFNNLTTQTISEFIEIFDINDLNQRMWKQISKRLTENIERNKNEDKEFLERYQTPIKLDQQFKITSNGEMKGIIKHLFDETGGQIDSKISFTSSENLCGSDPKYLPRTVSLFNEPDKYFISSGNSNSWICLDFKEHRIIPTDYTIRVSDDENFLRNWVFEISNDNEKWTIIDEQQNNSYLRGKRFSHTFHINNEIKEGVQFIRIKQTGPNWYHDQNYLIIESLEIYGTLI